MLAVEIKRLAGPSPPHPTSNAIMKPHVILATCLMRLMSPGIAIY
jgi:hypothetical protein